MLLITFGMVICVLEMLSGSSSYLVSLDMTVIFLITVVYAVYGYKFPLISVQTLIASIAIIDIIALFVSVAQGAEVGNLFLVMLINCLLLVAAIVMKKSLKISQILLFICFLIDIAQLVIKNIHAPKEPLIFYLMSCQFVIMEATLMLINYSYHQRQQNIKAKASN